MSGPLCEGRLFEINVERFFLKPGTIFLNLCGLEKPRLHWLRFGAILEYPIHARATLSSEAKRKGALAK
jgi:hypothetical protein